MRLAGRMARLSYGAIAVLCSERPRPTERHRRPLSRVAVKAQLFYTDAVQTERNSKEILARRVARGTDRFLPDKRRKTRGDFIRRWTQL